MKTDLEFVEAEIAGLHQQSGKREAKPSIKCDKAPEGKKRHSWKYLGGILAQNFACQYCLRKEEEVKAVPATKGRYSQEMVERINRLEEIAEQIRGGVLIMLEKIAEFFFWFFAGILALTFVCVGMYFNGIYV